MKRDRQGGATPATQWSRRRAPRGLTRGTILFVVFALSVSAGCVRLGFWQISRLRERRASNAEVTAMMSRPAVPLTQLPDSVPPWRRASAQGTYDFANEFVYTSRARNGAPGVYLITPLRLEDGTTVLVNRGWVYAADGMRIEPQLWHEDAAARVEGFVEPFSPTQSGPVSTTSVARGIRRLDEDSIAAALPYPVRPLILVQRLDSGEATAVARGIPVRVEPPLLTDGSHRAYAVQWFAFAVVGVAGTIVVVSRDRRTTTGHRPDVSARAGGSAPPRR